ncbi:MAG: malto-oligosyltrehalose trehalohydrolase [Deltaproteobacteria bacterium]|nr:malto-oligosyltrehalose trehalohydrolase [Deltaproteobacteria bacterium]
MAENLRGTFGPRWIDRQTVQLQLWAPRARRVDLWLRAAGDEHTLPMARGNDEVFRAEVRRPPAGLRYAFARDGGPPLPDPAAHWLPDGPLGWSELLRLRPPPRDRTFAPRPFATATIYELHVGAFTGPGTYRAAIERLDHLATLGIDVIELMPLCAFPGARNWGYDGVAHFAPPASYGTPRDLQRLVAEAHRRGLAVILDLVTNHFGPEGNAMWQLARGFFDPHRRTPWGPPPRFSSAMVRAYFAAVVEHWLSVFDIDGFRLDAFDAIARAHRGPHLQQMIERADELRGPRPTWFVLESDDDESAHLGRHKSAVEVAQLCFDHGRCIYRLATGERRGVYRRYSDPATRLVHALASGRSCPIDRGDQPVPRAPSSVVPFLQNHDTAGNRLDGQRLAALLPVQRSRALQMFCLLYPSPTLLFMGDEFAARTPFFFFCDFSPALGNRIARSRRREFAEHPGADAPGPAANTAQAFLRSKLDWRQIDDEQLQQTRATLKLRRQIYRGRALRFGDLNCSVQGQLYRVEIRTDTDGYLLLLNLSATAVDLVEATGELLLSSCSDQTAAAASLPANCTQLRRQNAASPR